MQALTTLRTVCPACCRSFAHRHNVVHVCACGARFTDVDAMHAHGDPAIDVARAAFGRAWAAACEWTGRASVRFGTHSREYRDATHAESLARTAYFGI